MTDIERAAFEEWFEAEIKPKMNGTAIELMTKEIAFAGWQARASRPVVVTDEMVERGASELGNPTVPTIFTRCTEENAKRVYLTGYADDGGSEVIRHRNASSYAAESDHYDLENEVLAKAVLSAALNGGT